MAVELSDTSHVLIPVWLPSLHSPILPHCSTIGFNAFYFSLRKGKRWINII